MHIGKGETDSKSKAMYFLPSLPKKMSEPTNEPTITTATATATATATDTTSLQNSPANSSTTISNTTPTPTDPDSNSNPLYTLPAPYDVADGFISFTDSFLYLGTLITLVTEITHSCVHTCNGLFICQLYSLPDLLEETDCKEDMPLTLPFASFVSLSQLIIVI
jgi:hypothetical protein